jgi:hypothetical protein
LRLWAATGTSIARLDEANGAWDVTVSLAGSGAQCLAVDPSDPDTAFAGLREHGLRRTRDGGDTWDDVGLPEPGVFSVAVSAADGAVYVGCEPSRLFRSDDGGDSWRALDSLLELPSRPSWSFPPRPWTSHVRWIAPSPHDPEVLLVGIELGGLMRSVDGGASFADHAPGAQPDVHSLTWHPSEPGRAYEAGGGGSAWSRDGGATWERVDGGRDRHYTWAVAVDPGDPDRWWVSASTGPFAAHGRRDPEARIYEWRGDAWQAVTENLRAMPYAFAHPEGRLVAGLADGSLLDVETGDVRSLGLGRISALA